MTEMPTKMVNTPASAPGTLRLEQRTDETGEQAVARGLLEPFVRNGFSASGFAYGMMGPGDVLPGVTECFDSQSDANRSGHCSRLHVQRVYPPCIHEHRKAP
jgi:hypothetical protein